jgi:hypothetical protein
MIKKKGRSRKPVGAGLWFGKKLCHHVYFKRQSALMTVSGIFVQDALAASPVNNANSFRQQRQSGGLVAGGHSAQESLDSGFHGTAVGTVAQTHSNVMTGFFCGGLVISHVIITPNLVPKLIA